MGKTSQTTSQSSSPPANVLQNYQNLVNQATNVANTPYQPYTGQVVPDLTQNQQQAFAQMSGLYGYSDPLYLAASQLTGQGTTPINLSSGYTNQFNSPYSQFGAANAMGAGQGAAAYGTNAGQGLAGYGVNAGQGLAGYGTSAGQGIGAYGTNAGQNIQSLAQSIGASGPQLQQYNQQNLQGYLNPYTQNVIDTTMANLNRNDAVQQNNLTGSAIQSGNAFGGDRAGVAAAELARNQDLANNQTIAGLESSGFQNAQQQFNQNNAQALAGQQTALSGLTSGSQLGLGALGQGAQLGLSGLGQGAQLGLSGLGQGAQLGVNAQLQGGQLGLSGAQLGNQGYQNAQQLALAQQQQNNANAFQGSGQLQNIGNQMYSNQLTAAQAQLAAGNQQQQQQAAQLAWPYQQYQQALAYPFQTTQFLGNTILGTGSASGGTGTTQSPGPNYLTQGIGALGTGVGALGATGAFGSTGWLLPALAAIKHGGRIRPAYASGGGVPFQNIQPIDFSSGPLGTLARISPHMAMLASRGKGPPGAPPPWQSSPGGLGGSGGFGALGSSSNRGFGLSGPAFGGGNFIADSYGGNSAHPLEGLTAADYGPGYRRGGMASMGGLVPYSPYGGAFADGGDVNSDQNDQPPPPSPYDAWNAQRNQLTNDLQKSYTGTPDQQSSALSALDNFNSQAIPPHPNLSSDQLSAWDRLSPAMRLRLNSAAAGSVTRSRGGLVGYAEGGMDDPASTDDVLNNRYPFAGEINAGANVMGNPAAARAQFQNYGLANPAQNLPSPYQSDLASSGIVPMPQSRPTAADTADNSDDEETPVSSYAPQTGAGAPTSSPSLPAPPPIQGAVSPAAALQAALQNRTIQKPDPWMALMQAGLGMMASRNPTLLGGIGEGGQAGLKNYEEQQKQINDLDAHPVIDSSGATQLIIYPSTGQVIDTGIPTQNAAQQAQRDIQNAQEDLVRDPKTGLWGPNQAKLDFEKQKADLNQKNRWQPAGTLQNGDVVHPAFYDSASPDLKIIDGATGKPPDESWTFAPKMTGRTIDTGQVKAIGDGIISGKLPPETSQLYGAAAPVKAYLSKQGFDLTQAQLEMAGARKQIATLNGPQMTRFVGLANSVNNTIDEVRDLSNKMQLSGVPKLNAAELAYYIQTQGNSPNGKLATDYQTAVGVLKEEFANLANGGYAPTEPAWTLANQQINGNYGRDQLNSSLSEVQRLINYRVKAIPGLQTMGPGAANRYTGQQAAPLTAPGAVAPPAASAVPPGKTIGETRQFKQGLGRWDGTKWVPAQ